MSERLLTAAEVADQLRRDAHWVNRMAQLGVIGAEKVGRFWRFTQADVDDYRARVRNASQSDPMAMSSASASRRRVS